MPRPGTVQLSALQAVAGPRRSCRLHTCQSLRPGSVKASLLEPPKLPRHELSDALSAKPDLGSIGTHGAQTLLTPDALAAEHPRGSVHWCPTEVAGPDGAVPHLETSALRTEARSTIVVPNLAARWAIVAELPSPCPFAGTLPLADSGRAAGRAPALIDLPSFVLSPATFAGLL